jgi:hypothetical protein
MKRFIFSLVFMVAGLLATQCSYSQGCDPLDAGKLKNMLTGMGYTVKELNTTAGKEKYEVMIKATGFNVPVAYEISSSGNFVWLTASLGKPKDETSIANATLLKQNGKIQLCQFYITEKGKLMIGLAVENRGLTPVIMRRHTDKIASDVSSTSTYWQ